MRRHKFRGHHVSYRFQFHLDIFEVGFAIGAGVKSDNLHLPRLGEMRLKSNHSNKQGVQSVQNLEPFKPSEKTMRKFLPG